MQGLMIHCGGYAAELSEVEKVETPEPTDSWRPIPHDLLWRLTEEEFKNRGIVVKDVAHSLARDGAHYFGLAEVEMPMAMGVEGEIHNLIIGLRNSHAKDFPASFVAGSRVFVCDNLCFSGEIKLGKKHTKNILEALPVMVAQGLSALGGLRDSQEQRIAAYRDFVLTDEQIVIEACKMARLKNEAFTWGMFRRVLEEVESPTYQEHKNERGESTVWTLQNAITETYKRGPNPNTALTRSLRTFDYLDNLTNFVTPANRAIAELREAVQDLDIDVG